MTARPNSIVTLGNITINGEDNYGFRMKDYFGVNNFYYDATNIIGSTGTITVAGKKYRSSNSSRYFKWRSYKQNNRVEDLSKWRGKCRFLQKCNNSYKC